MSFDDLSAYFEPLYANDGISFGCLQGGGMRAGLGIGIPFAIGSSS